MSADEEDSDLDKFIQSRLEEMMSADTEDAPKVSPIFLPPTKQSKLTRYFPGKQAAFLPPVKRRQEDRQPAGGRIMMSEKDIKRPKATHQEGKKDEEEIILTSSNEEEVLRLLSSCKELLFLLVFREGFTQFRDSTSFGSGFGSPLGVVVRVEGGGGHLHQGRAVETKLSKSDKSFLLHPSARKLAYNAKAFLSSLVGVFPPTSLSPSGWWTP